MHVVCEITVMDVRLDKFDAFLTVESILSGPLGYIFYHKSKFYQNFDDFSFEITLC